MSYAKLFAIVFCFVSFVAETRSEGGGRTGRSTSGCGGFGCHGTNNNSTAVTYTGNTTIPAGSTASLSAVVTHASLNGAGFNLSIVNSSGANAGTLSAVNGQGTRISNNEITHSATKAKSGGNVTWNFNWQAPTTIGVYTMRAAGIAVNSQSNASGDVWNTSTQVITVSGVNVFTPVSTTAWCAGSSQQIDWLSQGLSNVTIEVSSNGGSNWTQIGTSATQNTFANTWRWTIPPNQVGGTNYRIRIADASNPSTNGISPTFTINGLPVITTQPTAPATAVCTFSDVTLSVIVSGTGNTYQWKKNGVFLSGKTSNILLLKSVSIADSGSYVCDVTGSCGIANPSSAARVLISKATKVTTQPAETNVCLGMTATLSTVAEGDNLSYQWRKNTIDIPGATSRTFTIPKTVLADTGFYSVRVQGGCGFDLSNYAALKFTIPPAVNYAPTDSAICEGTTHYIWADIPSNGPLTYQWWKNGTVMTDGGNIIGAKTNYMSIANFSEKDDAKYSLQASSTICSTTVSTVPVQLIFLTKPILVSHSKDTSVQEGNTVVLRAEISGKRLEYLWYKNGVEIPQIKTNSITILSAKTEDIGEYQMAAWNACGSITTNKILVKVGDAPIPGVTLSNEVLNYGRSKVGSTIKRSFTITNVDASDLVVGTLTLTNPAFATKQSGFTLKSSEAKTVEVEFTSTSAMALSGRLQLQTPRGKQTISLTGIGIEHALSPLTIDFGTQRLPTSQLRDTTILFCNLTSETLSIEKVDLGGTDPNSFGVITPLPIAFLGDSCQLIMIRFHPKRVDENSGQLKLTTSQGEEIIRATGIGDPASGVDDDNARQRVVVIENPSGRGVTISAVEGIIDGYEIFSAEGTLVAQKSNIGAMMCTWTGQNTNQEEVSAGIYFARVFIEKNVVVVPVAYRR